MLDGSLDDWQEVMDLALRFSTRCATSYRRGSDRTRKLFNAAVLDEVHVRDGHVVEATYKEPFDLLFSSPKFEYGDVVRSSRLGLTWSFAPRSETCSRDKRTALTFDQLCGGGRRPPRRRRERGSASTAATPMASNRATSSRSRRSLVTQVR